MHFCTSYYWEGGSKTEKNQDSLALCQMVANRKRCLMATVCDGIGSLPDSERASGYVTEQLIKWFFDKGSKVLGKGIYSGRLKNIVKRELYRIRKEFEIAYTGQWGCTLSMVLICGRCAHIWNVGDGRIYLGRMGKCKLLTVDDVRKGMLTKCIGSYKWQGVFYRRMHIKQKDCLLVCSDGFYSRFNTTEIKSIMNVKVISEAQTEKLLGEAVLRLRSWGEHDDISVIYIKVGKEKYN